MRPIYWEPWMLGEVGGLGAPSEAVVALLPPSPPTPSLRERRGGLLVQACGFCVTCTWPSVSGIRIPWSKMKPRDRQWAGRPVLSQS